MIEKSYLFLVSGVKLQQFWLNFRYFCTCITTALKGTIVFVSGAQLARSIRSAYLKIETCIFIGALLVCKRYLITYDL